MCFPNDLKSLRVLRLSCLEIKGAYTGPRSSCVQICVVSMLLLIRRILFGSQLRLYYFHYMALFLAWRNLRFFLLSVDCGLRYLHHSFLWTEILSSHFSEICSFDRVSYWLLVLCSGVHALILPNGNHSDFSVWVQIVERFRFRQLGLLAKQWVIRLFIPLHL